MSEVKVYCKVCNKVFWEGSLVNWTLELCKTKPPDWANEAFKHDQASKGQVVVKYPYSGIIPFDLFR